MASQAEPESSPLHRLQEKLWNDAYDGLKELDPKLIQAYETILSNELRGSASMTSKNDIATDRRDRSLQMERIIASGLERTQKEAAVKARIGREYEIATGLKKLVDTALKAAPEAALVWAGVWCSLEVSSGLTKSLLLSAYNTCQIISSSLTQPGINRDGLEYVVTSMEWYWNLSRLLVDEKTGMDTAMRGQLEKSIIRLYKKLLLYQMRSACVYRRKRISVSFRDALKLDDWQGKLDEIKDAEATLRNEASQYNDEATIAQLKAIERGATESINNLRAWHEEVRLDDKNREALRDLHITDPRKDKKRIEELKGGLIEDSYHWILGHEDYQTWRGDLDSTLLWIKGDPGKGKTMLVCGIIDELEKQNLPVITTYFFCQATEDRLKTATSVLRGLLFLLIERLPPLVSHLREEYDSTGKDLFTNHNAWTSMSKILTSILSEPSLDDAVILIDALDECEESSRPRLISLISRLSSLFPAKWIVSSRNWPEIDREFGSKASDPALRLRLEMNQDLVSAAISTFIEHKIKDLDYRPEDKIKVVEYLKEMANGTFLWVALVCKALAVQTTFRGSVQKRLKQFPAGLDGLYKRMVDYIEDSEGAEICRQILSFASVAYRPLSLEEHFVCIDWRCWSADEDENGETNQINLETLRSIILSCGSFLIVRDDVVYFVHQSAQDFLRVEGSETVMPLGVAHQHQVNLFRSLDALDKTLRRDIYNLKDPGISMDEISPPEPNPLTPIVYHSYSWVDHLCDWHALKKTDEMDKMVMEKVYEFLSTKTLHWLEAHSLLGAMPNIVTALWRLVELAGKVQSHSLLKLTKDAVRFVSFFRGTVEQAPLQIYASVLLFSPTQSTMRQLFFQSDGPSWVTLDPEPDAEWNSCVHTLEPRSYASGFAFSPCGRRLASFGEHTIIVWDTLTGERIWDLNMQEASMEDAFVRHVAFAPKENHLAIACRHCELWDFSTGERVSTLLHAADAFVYLVAFHPIDGKLATMSNKAAPKIWLWDTSTCKCLKSGLVSEQFDPDESYHGPDSLVFSQDGRAIISATSGKVVRVWSHSTGLRMFQSFEMKNEDYLGLSLDGRYLARSIPGVEPGKTTLIRTVEVFHVETRQCMWRKILPDVALTSVFWPDNQRVGFLMLSGTLHIFHVMSGDLDQVLNLGLGMSPVAAGPAGQLATNFGGTKFGIWNLDMEQPRHRRVDIQARNLAAQADPLMKKAKAAES
ncbi:hypothetical protein QQX98_000989 [Neonectria punicea]|uniref:NACHT domain-containing protein n=1 Tax=Neonectria punicea TaxID=979145 RepID=A0ABR1HR94_9HYPO